MRPSVLGLLALAALAAPSPAAAEAGAERGSAAAAVERFVRAELPRGASGTLIAARPGEPAACVAFGYADRARGRRAGCGTVYDVMSITKQFTAAAILKLEMMGRLAVTDPIGEHVRGVPAPKRAITVHHLLTHTSGLPGAVGDDYERTSRRELLDAALGARLRAAPGTEYRYSNAGYSVLAAIVERASGMGYEEFLARHLFRPAGMERTGYALPHWERRRVAVEYDARGRPMGRPFDHPWAADGPHWNLRGNGGMLSTARDMLRWDRALAGEAVLDAAAKAKLFHPHALEEPGGSTYYGYGWVIADAPDLGRIAWHNGGNGWSYGEFGRMLDGGATVFWVANRSRDSARGWNLARSGIDLTLGVAAILGE